MVPEPSWNNAAELAEQQAGLVERRAAYLEKVRRSKKPEALVKHAVDPRPTKEAALEHAENEPKSTLFPVLANPVEDLAPLPPQSFEREAPITRVDQEKLTPDDVRRLNKAMWRRAFAEERMTLEQLTPWRVRVAWRLVREIAFVRGLLSPGYSLEEQLRLPTLAPRCPWLTASSEVMPSGAHSYVHLRAIVAEGPHPQQGEVMCRGLPLLPPKCDQDLVRYVEALEIASFQLGIERGSREEPRAGIYGLRGLLDTATVRQCFPHPTLIHAWDQVLIQETTDFLTHNSRRKTFEMLRDRYGLVHRESDFVVAAALTRAKDQTEADTEQNRALMISRLEDIADRARESLNFQAELAATKALAVVQGLAKVAAKDPNKEFMRLIKESAARDRKPQGSGDGS